MSHARQHNALQYPYRKVVEKRVDGELLECGHLWKKGKDAEIRPTAIRHRCHQCDPKKLEVEL